MVPFAVSGFAITGLDKLSRRRSCRPGAERRRRREGSRSREGVSDGPIERSDAATYHRLGDEFAACADHDRIGDANGSPAREHRCGVSVASDAADAEVYLVGVVGQDSARNRRPGLRRGRWRRWRFRLFLDRFGLCQRLSLRWWGRRSCSAPAPPVLRKPYPLVPLEPPAPI